MKKLFFLLCILCEQSIFYFIFIRIFPCYHQYLPLNTIIIAATQFPFFYTGGSQQFTVPYGVSGDLQVDISGASGGSTSSPGTPGYGARVQASLHLPAGTVLYIYVGGKPITSTNYLGGFNGGGSATSSQGAAGGGGASDIRMNGNLLSDRIVVAGGGGGTSSGCGTSYGGDSGEFGSAGSQSTCCSGAFGGGGASQTSGGAASTCGCSCSTFSIAGILGTGGNAADYGGGGGGGFYGGGGGGYASGGGGGSSYCSNSYCSSVTYSTRLELGMDR
jgi:hypothetical protein